MVEGRKRDGTGQERSRERGVGANPNPPNEGVERGSGARECLCVVVCDMGCLYVDNTRAYCIVEREFNKISRVSRAGL